jgi:tRNA modification GTPase
LDIGGLPVIVADTAGLRHTNDMVEIIGVERAKKAFVSFVRVLLMLSELILYDDPAYWEQIYRSVFYLFRRQ